jgi:hypothetical protein
LILEVLKKAGGFREPEQSQEDLLSSKRRSLYSSCGEKVLELMFGRHV